MICNAKWNAEKMKVLFSFIRFSMRYLSDIFLLEQKMEKNLHQKQGYE